MRIGAAAPRQLVTIFGSRLASATVTFDGAPAQLLYASDSQINVAVPLETARQSITVLLVTMNGASAPARQFPVVISNPSLFASVAGPAPTCTVGSSTISAPVPAVARNPDGEFNSCAQPTHAGSVVSLYVNGAGVVQRPDPGQPILIPVAGSLHPDAVAGAGSAEVVRAAPENDFVWRVDVRLPASIAPAHEDTASLTMRLGDLIVGPRSVASRTGPALPVSIWVSP
jgi:uncharacterized protein (TIGR03437 family)